MLEIPNDIKENLDQATEPRHVARRLYFEGWRISSIARRLKLRRSTVNSWKHRDGWEKVTRLERVETALESRIVQLIAKEVKGNEHYKELDALMRQLVQAARVRRYEQPGGNETDLNPKIANRNAGPKKKPVRNEFSEEAQARIVEAFTDSLFDYQKVWFRNGHERTRAILKSRQIGATWYFAREALIDAIQTGRNQIFLSASKSQAHVFKQYIIQFAKDACGVELSGDPIVLPNGAHLYFLGTNARTAQGYHGNFYFDEFFWTQNFTELNKVASGMALHKKWRKTYFSTPSATTHQAYPFWTGETFAKRRSMGGKVKIDISHSRLSSGFTGEDKIWRQIVTIMDAAAGGCDLFDIDELRDYEYTPDQFENLLMCNFVDDSLSVFPLADLQRGMVEMWDWEDFKPFAERPFGNRPVWIGYDPSLTGDSAGCSVIAPPAVPGGPFRVLERHQWRGKDFAEQAQLIKQMTTRFNVQYIGIDTTGMGVGVFPLVQQFFPMATPISYSAEVKTRMVLKAQHLIRSGRLQFDAGWIDIAQSFMAIRKILTPSGRAVTYDAGRSEETGHADLAWSVMHALDYEPFGGTTANNTSSMEFF
ncbi:terminase large subunit domain-containing protein [Herbaspirillum robiniae]|uniref:terminase large subunit domain-containing protein n=1 Tax=Herbaspirillum robiniae TaxID=2014887 RepID=UPI0009A20853|nr:terminase family protein [Herbaspirillum robiniae]